MRRRFHISAGLGLLLILLPGAAWADMPIFLVFASVRVTFWWTVAVAIAIEAVALWGLFRLTWRRALWAALVVNIGTALLGFVIYPLAGMVSYPVLAPVVTELFGTGQAVEIAAYCVAAAVIDTPVELLLLSLLSRYAGYGIRIGRKAVAVFALANLASAAVLFAAIEIGPRQAPVDAATQALLGQFAAEVDFLEALFAALPDHVDAAGKLDRAWLAELRQEAEGMAFLEVMVGTNKAQYAVVPLTIPETISGYSFSYEGAQYQGVVKITRGALHPQDGSLFGSGKALQVLHYHMRGDGSEPVPLVRAMLLMPDSR